MARLLFPLLVVLVVLAVHFASGEIMEMASDVDSEGFVEQPESPYFDAARTGSLERINREISLGHDVNVLNQDGWSPLMFAVEAGQSYAMYMLIKNGADVDVQDRDGWSPLMFAAHAGNKICVDILLDAKANPLLSNREGFGAHSIAQFEGHTDLAKRIATEAALFAMLHEDFASMMLMIGDGASPNAQNSAGWTPLIAAVSAGHEETVRALLDTEGINLNLAENDGWTPLMFAANNNRAQITRLLIERGADTSLKSRVGFSAMGIARDHNFMDVVALFKSALAIRRDFLAIPKVVVKVKESNYAAADVQAQQSAARYNPATQPAGNRAAVGKKAAEPRPATATSTSTSTSTNVPEGSGRSAGGAAQRQQAKAEEKKKSGWFW